MTSVSKGGFPFPPMFLIVMNSSVTKMILGSSKMTPKNRVKVGPDDSR